MEGKIHTVKELIDMLSLLPDSWTLTKCIHWQCPETVAMGIGYADREIRQHIEIQVDGPTTLKRESTELG